MAPYTLKKQSETMECIYFDYFYRGVLLYLHRQKPCVSALGWVMLV